MALFCHVDSNSLILLEMRSFFICFFSLFLPFLFMQKFMNKERKGDIIKEKRRDIYSKMGIIYTRLTEKESLWCPPLVYRHFQ